MGENRLAEANEAAAKGGRKSMAKLKLVQYKPKHLILTRHSKNLNAESRSSNSNKMKTKRTKMQCLSWLKNCKQRSRLTRSKSKKQKKLLLSTLLNTEKHNKSWKKPKTAPKWLKLILPHLANTNCNFNQPKNGFCEQVYDSHKLNLLSKLTSFPKFQNFTVRTHLVSFQFIDNNQK